MSVDKFTETLKVRSKAYSDLLRQYKDTVTKHEGEKQRLKAALLGDSLKKDAEIDRLKRLRWEDQVSILMCR